MIAKSELSAFLRIEAQNIFAPMHYTFYLKNEPDRSGKNIIYLNINLAGERKRISTGIKISPKYWSDLHKNIIDTPESHDDFLEIELIKSKISSIRIKHRLAEQPLTMKIFLEHLKTAPATVDFIEFYKSIRNIQDLSESTLLKHDGIFEKLKKYWPKIAFADINHKWFDEVRAKFKLKEKNAATTINSNISVLKKYLGIATTYGVKIPVDLEKVTVGPTSGRIIWLNENEIKKLEEYYFSSFIPERYKNTLGYFLVACFTGLRISDVKSRSREEMLEDYIQFWSVKGKKDQYLRVIPKVHQIIEDCDILFTKFKAETNINLQLKDIAKICGIKKRLFFHVGRHSFATNYILKGGNVKTLQIILGHKKITTTMKYVHIADDVAADSMMIMN